MVYLYSTIKMMYGPINIRLTGNNMEERYNSGIWTEWDKLQMASQQKAFRLTFEPRASRLRNKYCNYSDPTLNNGYILIYKPSIWKTNIQLSREQNTDTRIFALNFPFHVLYWRCFETCLVHCDCFQVDKITQKAVCQVAWAETLIGIIIIV